MKPELTVAYIHSIQSEPLPRFIEMSEAEWVEQWRSKVSAAVNSDLVGLELYEAFPSSWPISHEAWDARLKANWARLIEYDRLTAELTKQSESLKAGEES